jgi:hypothetical protein
MTPKEKAIELIDSFEDDLMECDTYFLETAKQRCALKVVDEILNVIDRDMNYQNVYSFYLNVKQEIEKL